MLTRVIELSVRHRGFFLFLIVAGVLLSLYVLRRSKLEALPDLSDTQVIVEVRWDRPPQVIEDQVTYPLVSKLLGAPRVKAIRSLTDFGYSFIYVIFQDGTDLYWARSRVLEYLSSMLSTFPPAVRIELGPDATGLGWILQYALVDRSGTLSLERIRAFQDFTLRYALLSVPGVAEVAGLGGFQREYQVEVDPLKLQYYGVSWEELTRALRGSSEESGARLMELSGFEFMVRLQGYARNLTDLEDTVVTVKEGVPITLGMLGKASIVPALRRGAGDLNGRGEVVGGIVVMRDRANAYEVIRRVKEKLQELKHSFPPGLELVITYDRSELIEKAIGTLKHELLLEMIVVALVILFSLGHIPSALVAILTIPVVVLFSFVPLYLFDIPLNLLSLAGIAISIGVLVDGAIIAVENSYNRVYQWQKGAFPGSSLAEVRMRAAQEVAPALFFALLIIAVSFLPIFAFQEQEGRLFKPMAYSKTFVMVIAALMAVTLTPALLALLSRQEPFRFRPRWLSNLATSILVGRYQGEEEHPLFGPLVRLYSRILPGIIRHASKVVLTALLLMLLLVPLYLTLEREFMPPLYEGSLLFMPTTLPGVSLETARQIMSTQDRILKGFPEVLSVHGKAGRAETSTDPSPLSMWETVVLLKEESQWRKKERWYSFLPRFTHFLFRPFLPDHLTPQELIAELDEAVRMRGVVNSWTMPIRNRIDMLTTGIRTPVGVKVMGNDLATLEGLGGEIEAILKELPGTRSVFAERVLGGYYLEVIPRRRELARFGFTVAELEMLLTRALGGEEVGTLIAGRERYPLSLRLPRAWREDPQRLARLLVPTPSGEEVFLGDLVELKLAQGPAMIRSENGFRVLYVFVDPGATPVGTYVEQAKQRVQERLSLPPGYLIEWSGQYENILRIREHLKIIVPLTLLIIFVLLYVHARSLPLALIVLCAVPFSLLGAFLLMHLLDYHLSVAVWVGIIALLGLDAETGIVMLLYLELAYKEEKERGKLTRTALRGVILAGASKRLRPKLMTVSVALIALLPVLFSTGIGADVMQRIAAPMIGGLITSFLMELLVYPAIYWLYRVREVREEERGSKEEPGVPPLQGGIKPGMVGRQP